jgi:hypothetical protein
VWAWLQKIWDFLFVHPVIVQGGNMGRVKVAVINATTVLKDSDIQPVVSALQIAVSRDFAPIWGVDCTLSVVGQGQRPPAGYWWMVLMDNSDQQGALGYHYDLTPSALPIGKIFVKTSMDAGDPWSTCLGHELYEALIDPYINDVVQVNNLLYAKEVADAVEAQTYEINGVAMTNFCTPLWFQPDAPPGAKYDFLGKLTAPLQLAPGGYIGVLDLNNPGQGWGIVTADKEPNTIVSSRPKAGSRRDRRRTPRELWIKSPYYKPKS